MEARGRNQNNSGPKAGLNLIHFMSLLIQKEGRNIHRQLRKNSFGVFLQRLFFEDSKEA